MTDNIICGDIYFKMMGIRTNRIDLGCYRNNGGGQCILTFDRHPSQIYVWYDEGRYPKCIDTQLDNFSRRKLIITGVDEL